MALRTILTENEPTLYKHCREQKDFNPRLHQLLDDMRETMLSANGVGLAAPQVGVLRRVVIVADTNVETEDGNGEILELVNPEILEREGEQDGPEGCLSFPGQFGMVVRPERVLIRAQDRDGNTFERWGEGLTARAFCHEIDHLEGHVFKELVTHMLTEEELNEYYAAQQEEEEDADGPDGEEVE